MKVSVIGQGGPVPLAAPGPYLEREPASKGNVASKAGNGAPTA
jgi:hypothetical protein